MILTKMANCKRVTGVLYPLQHNKIQSIWSQMHLDPKETASSGIEPFADV